MQLQFVLFPMEPLKAERQSNAGPHRSKWCKVRCGIELQHLNYVIPFINVLILAIVLFGCICNSSERV